VKHSEARRRDLLIGWGNALREDDGVDAPSLEVEAGGWRNLCVIERTQLTPDAGPRAAAARRVLFCWMRQLQAAAWLRWLAAETRLPAFRLSGPAELFSHHTSAGGCCKLANTL